jgi:pilus assembly protein CpaB
MRAITIQADQSSSFGGLVRPGDRVDIFITLDRPTLSGDDERVTVPLLQSLMVLAAGQDTGVPQRVDPGTRRRAPPTMQNVTLSATVEQSQMIAFARQRGNLTLVLRNPDDPTIAEGLGETTLDDLVTIERRETAQRSRPRTPPPEAASSMTPVRIRGLLKMKRDVRCTRDRGDRNETLIHGHCANAGNAALDECARRCTPCRAYGGICAATSRSTRARAHAG